MKQMYLRSSQGLSLLEVLISMVILGIGVLGLAPMLVLSIDANSISRDFSIATQLAKEKLEFYEAEPTISGVPFSDEETNLRSRFTRTTYVIDNSSDTTLPDNVYQISVSLSWPDDLGKIHSTSMSTLIRKAT